MTLYSHNGGTPAPLPPRIRRRDGRLRTDPSSFTEAEIADAGYVAAPDRPSVQPWQQAPTWDAQAWKWVVQDRPLTDVQAETLRSIRSQAESRLRPLLEEYTEPERLSWERQLAQARAYEADNNAATPLLDALATARGLTRQQMADKVIAAAEQFETQAGAIIGVQQAAEDTARNAATPEDAYKARNVDWPS